MKILTGFASFSLFLTIAAVAFPNCANAATFAEGKKDAGQTLPTAKIVDTSAFGTPLDTITGAISKKADLYQIYLTGGDFSADTNGKADKRALKDTQLFLFDASGKGVFWNDDVEDSLRAQFSISNVAAGIYYLGISGYGYNPVSEDGEIFSEEGGGPTGPGGASPLTGWEYGEDAYGKNRGTYSIALTGATFVPEPSGVLGLLAFAGLGGGAFFKRRRIA